MSNTPEHWYDKKWLIVLLCLFFFPVGLYGLWKSDVHSQGFKIGMTVFIAALIIFEIVISVMRES